MHLYLYLYLGSVYLYLPSKNHLYLYLYLPKEKLLYLYLQSFFCICPNSDNIDNIYSQCKVSLYPYPNNQRTFFIELQMKEYY